MVTQSRGHEAYVQPMGHSPCGSVRHQVEHQVPTFVSPVLDPRVLEVDALSLPCQHVPASSALTKMLRQSNTPLLLLTPAWSAKPWFLNLLELSINQSRHFLVTKTFLRQPWSVKFHLDPGRLQLLAWKPVPPGRQQIGLQPLKLCPPSLSMIEVRESSVLGVLDKRQILSPPLFP